MKRFNAWLICLILISCSNAPEWKKQLTAADSLVIHFNIPETNTIEKTVNWLLMFHLIIQEKVVGILYCLVKMV